MSYAVTQSGIAVRADSPFKTFKDLVEYARKNPGKVTYSTTGVGTPMHLAMEFVGKKEHVAWTHVPYPGSMPAVTACLGGQVTAVSAATEWAPFVKAGKLRLLATHGEARMKAFPSVPTMRELGYDFINDTIFLIGAPKGTPNAIVAKLEDALHKSMSDPAFIDVLAKIYHEPAYRGSAETKKYLKEAWVRYGEMIKDIKMMPDEPAPKK
jgi:tripartite-type tricarboxylate transporter receptor subunit TctC